MSSVLTIADLTPELLGVLLAKFQLQLQLQADDEDIQGSFWGASEAGLVGTTVFVRSDTPVHSLLHEAGDLICMTSERRAPNWIATRVAMTLKRRLSDICKFCLPIMLTALVAGASCRIWIAGVTAFDMEACGNGSKKMPRTHTTG